ncbi:MAG: hypothetical protein FJY73_09205 [Candidatus Eisenbacteria bacterium]|nr:hypothetical protein [Candidatus Eisenbacteria bacterium]
MEPVSVPVGNYVYVARDGEGKIAAFGHLVIEGQAGDTLSGSLWVMPPMDRMNEEPPDKQTQVCLHLPAVGTFHGRIKGRRILIADGFLWAPWQVLVSPSLRAGRASITGAA